MAGHRFDHEAFPTETYAWSWGGIWAAPGGASIRDRLNPVTCLLLWARSRGATGETDLGTESAITTGVSDVWSTIPLRRRRRFSSDHGGDHVHAAGRHVTSRACVVDPVQLLHSGGCGRSQ